MKYQTGHDPQTCCICGDKAIYRMPHGEIILISANIQNPKFNEVVKGYCAAHRADAIIEMQQFPLELEGVIL